MKVLATEFTALRKRTKDRRDKLIREARDENS
jgi:hypothetical protein